MLLPPQRLRWVLVPGALALAALGLVALTGVPGRLAPMTIGVDSLDYVDASLPIHRDMVFFREQVGGLNVARVIQELGGASLALYPRGGPTGPCLQCRPSGSHRSGLPNW